MNGFISKREICGKDIIKTGGPQRFCDDCAKIHLKELDNMQSLDWKRNNPEKYRESKRKFSKKRYAEDSEKDPVLLVFPGTKQKGDGRPP